MARQPEVFDIFVRRAKATNRLNRPRGVRQGLWRDEQDGPVALRISATFYRSSEKQNRLLERSWVVTCRTSLALDYVRSRLHELMRELDRARVVEG